MVIQVLMPKSLVGHSVNNSNRNYKPIVIEFIQSLVQHYHGCCSLKGPSPPTNQEPRVCTLSAIDINWISVSIHNIVPRTWLSSRVQGPHIPLALLRSHSKLATIIQQERMDAFQLRVSNL